MGYIISFFTPIINFVRINLIQIVAALTIGLVTTLVFYVTINSLRKMKSEVFAYYPFDKFFPASGKWSLLYFFITVLFLGSLIFFFAKGGFYLGPA